MKYSYGVCFCFGVVRLLKIYNTTLKKTLKIVSNYTILKEEKKMMKM